MAEWTRLELATPCVTGRYSNQLNYHSVFGGRNRIRTYDPLLVRQMLYQLSYAPRFYKHYLLLREQYYAINSKI